MSVPFHQPAAAYQQQPPPPQQQQCPIVNDMSKKLSSNYQPSSNNEYHQQPHIKHHASDSTASSNMPFIDSADTMVASHISGISLGTLLNSLFLKNIKLTGSDILYYGVHFIGILTLTFLVVPSCVFSTLLIMFMFVLLLLYIVSRAALKNTKSLINPEKLTQLSNLLKIQQQHQHNVNTVG